MTKLALLLLVLTSLAPVACVECAVAYEHGKSRLAAILVLATVFLVLLCLRLLAGVRAHVAPVPRRLSKLKPKEGEPLSFLLAYALPIVAPKATASPAGIITFALMMAVLVWQQQLIHMNPLLGLFGYHFFAAQLDDGANVLVIARRKYLAPGDLYLAELSPTLFLATGRRVAR